MQATKKKKGRRDRSALGQESNWVLFVLFPFPGATWPSNHDKRIGADEVNPPSQHGRSDRLSTHGDHMDLRVVRC